MEESPELPSYEEVQRNSRCSSREIPSEPQDFTSRFLKGTLLKNTLAALVMFSGTLLLGGVVLGVMSVKYESFRLIGMIMILLGVIGVVSAMPCCFYLFMKMRRPRLSRRLSTNSQDSRSPAIVSDLYPSAVDNIALESQGVNRNARTERPADRQEPPYEPPPPYTIETDSCDC